LLYEKSLDNICDYVIVVVSSKLYQQKQAMKRKNMTHIAYKTITKKQFIHEKKTAKADFIIYNNYTKASLIKQINDIWVKLCAKSY
jgi:dephospho-CoA kinase